MAKSNIDIGREVIKIEADAVASLMDRIGEDFDEAVELVFNCKGRVIVTGMGKSGLISQKVASTLASTGTPAQFLHPGEAGHGEFEYPSATNLHVKVGFRSSSTRFCRRLRRGAQHPQ